MTDLQKKLFAAFESEYPAILQAIRSYLGLVEAGGDDSGKASLTEAFRMAHTLKGSAQVVGFPSIVKLAHRSESIFAKIRDGKFQLGVGEIRNLYSAVDAVEDIVSAWRAGQPEPDVNETIAALERALSLPASLETTQPANAIPVAKPTLTAVPSPSGMIASVTPTMTGAPPAGASVAASATNALPESETVRLNAAHLDQLLGTTGELLSVIRGNRQLDSNIAYIGAHIDLILREWELVRRTSAGAIQTMNQSPEFARIVQFLELVGTELQPLSKQVRATRDASKQSEWDLRHLSEQLQEDVRKARIVPAETVLSGFHQMVRGLSVELDRQVDFRMHGLDVEADRAVLQALKDPLMHMLRNSIGHGIEPKAIRENRGKDPIGKISVKLSAAGGRLVVRVEDDGQGLNEDDIKRRALSQGLYTADEAAQLSPEILNDLIFQPGFSTAKEISDLSGRGMGMSVVAETIKRLQGRIKVRSEAGRRLEFEISVPIALANHRMILVCNQGQHYAVPSTSVESLRHLRQKDLKAIDGKPSVFVGELPVPVVTLGAALGLADDGVCLTDEVVSLMVVRSGGKHVAIAVDEITDECEGLIKNLGSPLRKQNLFSGAVLQGDGSLALVIDPHVLLERTIQSSLGKSFRLNVSTPVALVKSVLRILVVDDSITTRTLEKGILESNGHHVTLAVDGMDALARLQVESFDLVISDVEMPRMDGFTLVGEIKKHPTLGKLPVIMVTSRENAEDRQRGLSLGASAYVLKQQFDQGTLLETIRQVV